MTDGTRASAVIPSRLPSCSLTDGGTHTLQTNVVSLWVLVRGIIMPISTSTSTCGSRLRMGIGHNVYIFKKSAWRLGPTESHFFCALTSVYATVYRRVSCEA